MTVFTKTAVDIFAAQDAAGNARKVSNHDAQVWGTEVERALAAFQAGGGVIFQSKDQADANLGYDANTMAWVFDDDPSLAGIYQKQGASSSGSWQRVGDLPYSFILATNTNSGDPNAIEATTAIPIPAADGGALIALPIVADNTASPVTVSFNGGPALTIKTIAGNDAPASALASGMTVWGFKQGDEFRLVTDLSSAGILAGAEAAAEAAEDAADRAQSYSAMLSADKVKFKTVPLLLADETMSYTPGSGLIEVGPGDIIEAEGFRYEIEDSAESTTLETAGGIKINLLSHIWRPAAYGIFSSSSDQKARVQEFIDDAAAFGATIEWGAIDLTIDPVGVTPDVRGLQVPSNSHWVFDPTTIFRALPNDQGSYSVFRADGKDNIVWEMNGALILGDRDDHVGATGEHGMGLSILGCYNFVICGQGR